MTVHEHYENLLAEHYTWMFGSYAEKVRENEQLFTALGVSPAPAGAHALDLGAGSGFQSVALARAGYSVTAVDFTHRLLAELQSEARGLPITTLEADITHTEAYQQVKPWVISCMGDTLTHLPTHATVHSLLTSWAAQLMPGGTLVLSFRDYSRTPTEADRFIPVQATETKLLTSVLEYGQDTLRVHDILHERKGNAWAFRVSSYPKLRLAPQDVAETLRQAGLVVTQPTDARTMVLLVGRKH